MAEERKCLKCGIGLTVNWFDGYCSFCAEEDAILKR